MEPMTPYEYARRLLIDYGFNVFPLKPRDKSPYDGFSWKRWQTERVTEEQLEAWNEQYPGCNWAVVCGAISDLVVYDADDEKALQAAHVVLSLTPFRVRTGKGWHWYYRYPEGREDWLNKLNLKRQYGLNVDTQRDGKYVVAPGSIHESGAIYTMEELFPDWNYVPVFDLDEQKLLEETGTRVSCNLTTVSAAYSTVEKGNRNNSLAKKVGEWCHERPRLLLDEVKRRAFDWCQEYTKPPLPLPEIIRTVESIYNKDKKEHPDELDTADLSDLDGVERVELEEVHFEAPDTITHPKGLLGRVATGIKVFNVRTTDILAGCGAYSILGNLLCQKFKTETGLTTNLMCINVGSSGLGKDAPRAFASKVIPLAGGNLGYTVITDVASDPALINHLGDYPHTLCCFDETGMLFKACNKPNSPKAGLVKTFTELFSNTSSPYTKVYASKDNNKTINWHALGFFGSSVAGELFQGLSNGEAVNGFAARNLFFIDDETKRLPKNFRARAEIAQDLIEDLRWLANFNVDDISTKQTEKGTEVHLGPESRILYLSDDAYAYLIQKSNEWDERQEAYENEGNFAAASFAGRAAEHAIKLSIIHFVSRVFKNIEFENTIQLEDMQEAWKTIDWERRKAIHNISHAVSESEFDAACQKVLVTIERAMRRSASQAKCASCTNKALPGATYAQLSRALPGIPDEILKKAIEKLKKTNQIRLNPGYKSSEKSKRAVDLYYLVKEKDEAED